MGGSHWELTDNSNNSNNSRWVIMGANRRATYTRSAVRRGQEERTDGREKHTIILGGGGTFPPAHIVAELKKKLSTKFLPHSLNDTFIPPYSQS